MEQTPFGEVALTTEGLRMPMRFPGQYADIESGFSYNYFRDYDPSLGRYLQPDPIGLRGGRAIYAYALSKPISEQDSRGLCPVCAVLGGLVFGGLNVVEVLNERPAAKFTDLAIAFATGALDGALTFSGIGSAASRLLKRWVLTSALTGSIAAGGRSFALDHSFWEASREVGLSAAFGTLAGGFANSAAVVNAVSLLKRGGGRNLARSDAVGAAFGVSFTYCGRRIIGL